MTMETTFDRCAFVQYLLYPELRDLTREDGGVGCGYGSVSESEMSESEICKFPSCSGCGAHGFNDCICCVSTAETGNDVDDLTDNDPDVDGDELLSFLSPPDNCTGVPMVVTLMFPLSAKKNIQFWMLLGIVQILFHI